MKKFNVLFLYLQEHWLPHHEAQKIFSNDFPNFNFLTTSSDMFLDPEDLALASGPVWHGTAIGWPSDIDAKIEKLSIVSNRFCGVLYSSDGRESFWQSIR
jgi:hypothetical protein